MVGGGCLPLCSSSLAKTIFARHSERGGGGRENEADRKKMWEDSIKEWTGLEFAKSQRAVENREKWRKVVVRSSVMPQRPPRLRDR